MADVLRKTDKMMWKQAGKTHWLLLRVLFPKGYVFPATHVMADVLEANGKFYVARTDEAAVPEIFNTLEEAKAWTQTVVRLAT